MNPFRVHIDLKDRDAAAALAALVSEGGGTAYFVMENSIPDILITEPGQLGSQPYLAPQALIAPRILLLGRPREMPAADLRGLPIFAFLDPATAAKDLSPALEKAVEEMTRLREVLAQYHEIERRYRELSTVVALTGAMALEFDVDQLLESMVDQISRDLGYKIVSIMLLEENGEHLVIKASRGLSSRIVGATRVQVGKGVAGSVASSGEPLLIRDIEKDPRFGKSRSHGRYSSKSLISVPLKVRDRVIGVLNANNRTSGGQLTEHDLRLLSLFASQASLNIERARLYRNLEEQAGRLRHAYHALQESDRIKSDFITNVSHEYRTPITIVLGYLELLKSSLDDDANLAKVETALEAAGRLSRLIDDSTDLLKLDTDSTPFDLQAVSVDLLLREAVNGMEARFHRAEIELVLDAEGDSGRVTADPEKMHRALEKLLDNSLKFTPRGGRVRVGARASDSDTLTLFVEDNGPGIPPEDRQRVFERFVQGGDIMTEKPAGTGLGLPIVRAIVARHHGTVEVDPGYGEGARILITLPLASVEGPAGPEPA